jgi:hypothetical protein
MRRVEFPVGRLVNREQNAVIEVSEYRGLRAFLVIVDIITFML